MADPVWGISTLERTLPDGDAYPEGTIKTVYWTVALEEQGERVSSYGATNLGPADQSGFIPYKDLTETQVIEWLKKTIGEDQIGAIENALQTELEAKIAPKTANGTPW
jgi:hypothetical protein